ncbi:hypothetical protein LCGC14_1203920 [marine sediment metagenome]|uniref:DksA C4-type domain-containing protein n=1 Tax=marine sediment metagenome TaxID=412755 RepID=A0A0F9LKD9_9ZZZZ
MTRLERIREEQEEIADRRLEGEQYVMEHRRWLALQREALVILRGEKCEEHGFRSCGICKPPGPMREERG